jgi:hypothetical protein
MSEVTPAEEPTFDPEVIKAIVDTAMSLSIGLASALVPGAPLIALLVAFLPQIKQLESTIIDFVTGKKVTDEDIAAAELMVRQQAARSQFEQWRIHQAAAK